MLIEFIVRLRAALTPFYIKHLEAEIELLRGQNARLQLKLEDSFAPKTAAPAAPRQFPKFTPAKTSWEAFLAEEIAKQEQEESQDGTSGSGR